MQQVQQVQGQVQQGQGLVNQLSTEEKEEKEKEEKEKKEKEKKEKEKKEKKDEEIREFISWKKSYFLLKKDIDNNLLNENNMNDLFKIKYNILKNMENKDMININDSIDNILIDSQINEYNLLFRQIVYDEMIEKYNKDKKIYYEIKEELVNNNIYESDIPNEFIIKYAIYKLLDKKNIINTENEYEQFLSLYNNYINKKEKKEYVPHNIHYVNKD